MFLCLRIVYKYLEKNFNLYWEGRGGESCSSLVRQGPALTGEIKFWKLSKQKIKSFRIQFHSNRREYCVPLFRRHLQQICWVVFTGCPDCFITFYEIVYTNRCSTSSSSSLGRNVKTSLRLYQELLEISDQKWQPTAALEIGNLNTSHQANILRRQVWNKQTEGKKTSKWSLEWSRFAGVQHLYWFIFITSSNYFTVKNCNARHCWKVSMRVSLSLGGTDRQGESVRLFPRDNFCVELRCARPQPWSFSASLQPSS